MNPTTTGHEALDPRVLLIGGAPLSGKTTVAQTIGRLLGLPVVSTDLLGEAARAVTDPSNRADLHACGAGDHRQYYTNHSPVQLLEHALRAHNALWPAIEAVIGRRLDWEGSAIIEGWALLPERVAKVQSPCLRCVWVTVPGAVLVARLMAQSGFAREACDPDLVCDRFIARSLLMNKWLHEQLNTWQLPLVELTGSESPEEVSCLCLDALGFAEDNPGSL
jgi:adenylate kinase family enzyme